MRLARGLVRWAGQIATPRLFAATSCMVLIAGCSTNQVAVWFENDALAYGPPTDANYTQGLQVTLQPKEQYRPCDEGLREFGTCETSSNFKRFVNWLNFLESYDPDDPDAHPIWLEYSFGQQFYTPDDISISEIIPDDRPYAGWLFGSLKINNDRTFAGPSKESWPKDRRRTVTLKLGVTGPASQSSAVQKWWHEDVCDCTYPNGWHNQIKNEVAFVVSGSQEDRLLYAEFGDRWRADLLSKGELSIGTVYTGLDVGATARFGYNLPRAYSPMTISPQALLSAPGPTARDNEFFAFGFAGVIGRAVARDIFLDGNTFTDSPHTVEKEPFVAEGQIGVMLGYGSWSLQVLYAHRSDQYKTQKQAHRFGSFTITYTP